MSKLEQRNKNNLKKLDTNVTCRGLVLLNWSGSKRESGIIISFRGDFDITGGCSQVVRLFSTVQGQIPHGGS